MGCDIHMYVEYQKSVCDKIKWINGDYFKPNPYFKQFEDEEQFSRMELHGNRNYTLFATLAGVRDNTGKIVPVAEPKGIPEDASEYVNECAANWEGDGHTHSWLNLAELKEYNKSAPIAHYTGLLDPQSLKDFDDKGIYPTSWCQGTNMSGYERREWSEINNVLSPLITKLQARAKELMQYDFQEYNISNDEKIRIVFWFDN